MTAAKNPDDVMTFLLKIVCYIWQEGMKTGCAILVASVVFERVPNFLYFFLITQILLRVRDNTKGKVTARAEFCSGLCVPFKHCVLIHKCLITA